MIRIETPRLRVRNFYPGDWEDLLDIMKDKEKSEYASYHRQFPVTEDGVRRITEWFAQSDYFLAVVEPQISKVIGYICVKEEIPGTRKLGYNLHSAYLRKGYAYEACSAVINYGFQTLEIEQFQCGTANLNIPSYNLLVKLGFTKTGEGKTSFGKTSEGIPIEFMGSSFALNKEEWEKLDYSSQMLCQKVKQY